MMTFTMSTGLALVCQVYGLFFFVVGVTALLVFGVPSLRRASRSCWAWLKDQVKIAKYWAQAKHPKPSRPRLKQIVEIERDHHEHGVIYRYPLNGPGPVAVQGVYEVPVAVSDTGNIPSEPTWVSGDRKIDLEQL